MAKSVQIQSKTMACAVLLVIAQCTGCGTTPGMDPPGGQGAPGTPGAQGDPGPQGPQGPAGVNGADGTNGSDGALAALGDGSAGSLIIPAGATETLLLTIAIDRNLQFTNVLVNAGATLIVPSGTVLRCKTNFVNAGTVVVQSVSHSGGGGWIADNGWATFDPPSAGISSDHAAGGQFGDNSLVRLGGLGGDGFGSEIAGSIFLPGPVGGGGGAGAFSGAPGGTGGGTFVVICGSGLANLAGGIIRADGNDGLGPGAGGGAGGVVVLASRTSVANNGLISAQGANGNSSSTVTGAGGSGGGGLVHLAAPSILPGSISVAAGTPGMAGAAMSVTNAQRSGGGGGGACAGFGGPGGDVTIIGTPTSAVSGTSGVVVTSMFDPIAMF